MQLLSGNRRGCPDIDFLFHIKTSKNIGESEDPDHIFSHICDKAASELVDKNKKEQQQLVIISPNFCLEKKKDLYAES
jgi:hypothetical protein